MGRDKGRSFGNLSDKDAPMSRIADKRPVGRRYNDLHGRRYEGPPCQQFNAATSDLRTRMPCLNV
jgi:hypothetical protein